MISWEALIEDSEVGELAAFGGAIQWAAGSAELDTALDLDRIWAAIPKTVRPTLQKRVLGHPLTQVERNRISLWRVTENGRDTFAALHIG